MFARRLSTIFFLMLWIGAGFFGVAYQALAQVSCSSNGDCTRYGPQYQCVDGNGAIVSSGGSGRCNLPPPIWNAAGTGLTTSGGQAASFDLRNNSQVRGDLTVGTTIGGGSGAVFTNAIYSRNGENAADTLWLGGNFNSIHIQGRLVVDDDLTAGRLCLGTDCRSAWPAAAGGGTLADVTAGSGVIVSSPTASTRLVALTNTCANGQILKWSTTTVPPSWTCAADVTGSGSGTVTTDHGTLTGLNNNDHPQYYLQTGDTRDLIVGGRLRIGGGTTFPAGVIPNNSMIAGGDLYSNTVYSRSTGSDDIWLGDNNDRLQIRGALTVGGSATVGGASVLTQPAVCSSGQVLKWNGATWDCQNDEIGGGVGGGGGLSGSGTGGQVAIFSGTGASTTVTSNNGLVWNTGTSRLGIGVANPATPLDVSGDVRFSGTLQGGTVPWARLSAFPPACPSGEFARGVGTTLTCAPAPASAIGAETDPIYTAWYNSGSPTIGTNLRVVGSGAFGNYIPDATWRLSAPNLYIGNGVNGTIIGAGLGQQAGDITTDGNLHVGGCLGPVIVGATVTGFDGTLAGAGGGNGYRGVDRLCAAAFSGSHQCATHEVMTSIHCGAIWTNASQTTLQSFIPASTFLWIGNGAPSLPTPTNDCYGWTETGVLNGQQSQGMVWWFESAGGAGYARPCNEQNRILCCR